MVWFGLVVLVCGLFGVGFVVIVVVVVVVVVVWEGGGGEGRRETDKER